jgi:hypothetical protein
MERQHPDEDDLLTVLTDEIISLRPHLHSPSRTAWTEIRTEEGIGSPFFIIDQVEKASEN